MRVDNRSIISWMKGISQSPLCAKGMLWRILANSPCPNWRKKSGKLEKRIVAEGANGAIKLYNIHKYFLRADKCVKMS